MSPEEFLTHVRSQVVGRPISFKRLAANSLLLYVDSEPGDEAGFLFWFEPSWHCRGPERVLAGSRQAQEDDLAADPTAGSFTQSQRRCRSWWA